MVAWGEGSHLGLPVRWCFSAAADGSWREETVAKEVTFCWGHATAARHTWEQDPSGCSAQLELDDEEVQLLSAFVRSGFWLRPEAGTLLEVTLCEGMSREEAEEAAAEATAPAFSPGPLAHLRLRLREGGRLVARLRVCGTSGVAQSMWLRMAHEMEVWRWHSTPGWALPSLTLRATASGARDVYRTDGFRPPSPLPAELFMPPVAGPSPAGATFDATASPRVPVERSYSGHALVPVEINGKAAGLAILDTGASGLVITRAAADAAGLEAFGKVFVSSVTEKLACRFRRAATVRVGPLTLHSPLLMEMEMASLASGASQPVIGIVGYDIFRRAVVDLPPRPALYVELYDPATWQPPAAPAWRWLDVAMVSNVPHLRARWHGAEEEGEGELLMLDSGAGGADAMFHARTVERLGLAAVGTFGGMTVLRGVSASGGGPARLQSNSTQRRSLDWLELLPARGRQAPVRFEGPVEVLLLGQKAQFDLSEHMAGVVGTSLLCRTRFVCDYGRRRVAFVEDG